MMFDIITLMITINYNSASAITLKCSNTNYFLSPIALKRNYIL